MSMSVKFSETNYKNFGKCLKIDNGVVTLLITVDVGPRVIYYSLNGKENVFNEDIERSTVRDSEELHKFFDTNENWYIYGGHRLWSSPESWPDSYTPDNSPVEYEILGSSVELRPAPRTKVGEQHIMTVTVDENSSKVTVTHKIVNISDHELKLAPWAMTVAEKGGVEIIPQCRRQTGLLSNRRMVIWEYTDVNDERFYMSNKYMTLRQTDKESSFKVGVNNEDGWCAYINKGQAFKKSFSFDENAVYPDYDVNFETFTNQFIVEIETLGKLETLKPGGAAVHNEVWELFPCDESFDCRSDESIEKFVSTYLK